MTTTEQIRPDNAQKIEMKGNLATFYIYETKDGEPCVRFYKGKSLKAKAYRFRSAQSRAQWIETTIQNIKKWDEENKARRAERNKAHDLKKGDILYTNWGYDQTNTEFYVVTDVPSKCYVELQEIAAPLVDGEDSFMSGRRFPNPEKPIGDKIRKKVSMTGGKPSVKIDSVATAWLWDGKEKRVSWYA